MAPEESSGAKEPSRPRRVLLKISGEALGDSGGRVVFNAAHLASLAGEIRAATDKCQIAIVVGGGNILRGAELQQAGLDRTVGDAMGMTATVINSLAIASVLEREGLSPLVLSAIPAPKPVQAFDALAAREALTGGKTVICAGGTGNPYFTTDTAAVLRAIELECDVLLKATQVDGIYSADPKKDDSAVKFETLSFDEVLDRRLQIMDQTAFALARESSLSIRVFDMNEPGNVGRAIRGEALGTLVTEP